MIREFGGPEFAFGTVCAGEIGGLVDVDGTGGVEGWGGDEEGVGAFVVEDCGAYTAHFST